MADKRCENCPHLTVVGHWDGRDPKTGKRTSGFVTGCTKTECAIYKKANQEIEAEKEMVRQTNRENGIDIEELRWMRKENEITIRAAAGEVGARLAQFSDWEKERKPMPKETADKLIEFYKAKEQENSPEVLTCQNCGKDTLKGRRASNGHFHGRCTNCGSTVIA